MLSVHLIHCAAPPGGGSPVSTPAAITRLGSGRQAGGRLRRGGNRILGDNCWKHDHQGNIGALFVSGQTVRQLQFFSFVVCVGVRVCVLFSKGRNTRDRRRVRVGRADIIRRCARCEARSSQSTTVRGGAGGGGGGGQQLKTTLRNYAETSTVFCRSKQINKTNNKTSPAGLLRLPGALASVHLPIAITPHCIPQKA